MPVVLMLSQTSKKSYEYDDVDGESYVYPLQYRKLINEGDVYVLYRGRRDSESGIPEYYACGIIGDIEEEPPVDGRKLLRCSLLQNKEFREPIPFKDQYGRYLELGGLIHSNHFRVGVRGISNSELLSILAQSFGGDQ